MSFVLTLGRVSRFFSKPGDGSATTTANEVDEVATSQSMEPAKVEIPDPPPTFEAVYEGYFAFVWRNVANRGVPEPAVDDVVQEVFLVVHRKLPEFEGRSSVRTWLAAIVRRVVRDHVRKRGNQRVGEPLEEEPAVMTQGPAEALDRKVAVALLDSLLETMSEAQREVFLLAEVEQMTSIEIGEALGVNENTVRTRLRAARRVFAAGVARHRAEQLWRASRG